MKRTRSVVVAAQIVVWAISLGQQHVDAAACSDDVVNGCVIEGRPCLRHAEPCCANLSCVGFNFYKKCVPTPACLGEWMACSDNLPCCQGMTCQTIFEGVNECKKNVTTNVSPTLAPVPLPPPAGPNCNYSYSLYNQGNKDTSFQGYELAASACVKLNCTTSTLCLTVRAQPGYQIAPSPDDSWIKDYDADLEGNKYVAQAPGIQYVTAAGNVVGWKGCFTVPNFDSSTRSHVEIHALYGPSSGSPNNTASTGKYAVNPDDAITLPLCPKNPAAPVVPPPTAPVPIPTAPVPIPTAPVPVSVNTPTPPVVPRCNYNFSMYNAGNSNSSWSGYELAAKACVTLNCTSKIMCVNVSALPGFEIDPDRSNSWIKDYDAGFNGDKFVATASGGITFLMAPGSSNTTIGWYGCFHLPTTTLSPTVRRHIEIHADYGVIGSKPGNTASTGKYATNPDSCVSITVC